MFLFQSVLSIVFFPHFHHLSKPHPPTLPIHSSSAGGSTPSRRARIGRPDDVSLRRRVEKLRRWSGDLSEVTFQVAVFFSGWEVVGTGWWQPEIRDHDPDSILVTIRNRFLHLDDALQIAILSAQTPLVGMSSAHIAYWIGRGTSRHVDGHESIHERLPTKHPEVECGHALAQGSKTLTLSW